ncbi:uncharacterized protein LOC143040497 [Oratosquilla oratoria]|uniref:uncharacterized protein LOC143040497 n=1 Tax=Oratosquilla oratoria TaxID=337810 RepID=UPI003F76DDA8
MVRLLRTSTDLMATGLVISCLLVSLCCAQDGEENENPRDPNAEAEAADEAAVGGKAFHPGLRLPGSLPLIHGNPGGPRQTPSRQGPPIPQGGPLVGPRPQQGPYAQGGPIAQPGPPQGSFHGPQVLLQQPGPLPQGAVPFRPPGQAVPIGGPHQLGPQPQVLVQQGLGLQEVGGGSVSTSGQAIPTIVRPPNLSKSDNPLPKRRVEDTIISCRKDHMVVTFRFNTAFSGLIYPYNHYRDCTLARGSNQREVTLTLRHGVCGDKDHYITRGNLQYRQALIEHALMVQWEVDFVCDDDQHFIVRCERPDDFNKTVAWNYGTKDLQASFHKGQHPGPNMAMEIQYGEGPHAPPVDAATLVVIGDTLTLVFTLSDRVFWFDSNVLDCVAYDGAEETSVEVNPQTSNTGLRPYTGQMQTIENSCSVKPKVFSHFRKEKDTINGYLTTIHYALFKAFRFPTSNRLRFVCNVQVCYRQCPELPPCSQAFHPRHAAEASRKRRAIDEDVPELENALLVKTIDVEFPDQATVSVVPATVQQENVFSPEDCYSSTAFFGTIIGFSFALTILLVFIIVYAYKDHRPTFFSPRK